MKLTLAREEGAIVLPLTHSQARGVDRSKVLPIESANLRRWI